MQKLLFLELNEINFEFLQKYIGKGNLPNFREFLARHGFEETHSEQTYEELEPWIQWVTAHTGLTYAEHGVFRLGDIVDTDIPQIWEQLEEAGLKVGAVSPMNAKYRLRDPAFFIPDPWTDTSVRAGSLDTRFFQAIRQAVNENATGGLDKKSVLNFALGGLRNASPANYPAYLKLVGAARGKPWSKALFLDQVLTDMFVRLVREKTPDFATLFLNAGAHIQHHYMFNAAVYDGPHRNPAWYIHPDSDPLLDVYRLYDQILGQVKRAFPQARIMLATGLHQTPYEKTAFYWRLTDHAASLRGLGVPFQSVEPRMSRDFLIACSSMEEAAEAERKLLVAKTEDGTPIFTVDNRGEDLFAMLSYPNDIPAGMAVVAGNERIEDFRSHVAFVAIKNGEHHGVGYFSDSAEIGGGLKGSFPLTEIPNRIRSALEVEQRQVA
ncbi:hypothetical protein GRI47_11725 [Erythrobacter pelagi]|uniref:Sulfatase-like hydrolase/transferase n=1 Tax=Qipengyuania pelagi TaxID=994320 RepID=A0A844YB67_9SPHN|nr:hypothetical protein [Qipengyuania pelagi]